MPLVPLDDPKLREALSALADGELDERGLHDVSAAWRDDEICRSTWHAYQLIGDVLRSDDLARGAASDAAFLQRLRCRLDAEPVVLVPQAARSTPVMSQDIPVRAARTTRWAWLAPTAVAAGFVVVAGTLVVTRSPQAPVQAVAVADQASGGLRQTLAQGAVAAVPVATMAEAQPNFGAVLVRDPNLDRYLSAHQEFSGSSALGVPSAFLRSATVDGSGR